MKAGQPTMPSAKYDAECQAAIEASQGPLWALDASLVFIVAAFLSLAAIATFVPTGSATEDHVLADRLYLT